MKKKYLAISLAVVAALAIAGAVGLKVVQSKNDKKNQKKPDVALVFEPREVTQPKRTAMPISIEFSGPLVAPQTAVVRAKAAGSLLSLTVAEGSRVKVGQLIGRVDTTDMDNRVAERRAMLEAARAQEAQAQRTHATNLQLAEQKFISPNALDASRVAVAAAAANSRAAAAQIGSVRAAASLATLVAPIDGIVAKRHVVAGEKLSPEQQVITIVDVRKLEVAGSVGTHEVSLLKVGMALTVQVEGSGAPRTGTLARIAPAAEAGTRAIGVSVLLDNADESLRAGQYALVRTTLADSMQRLTLPSGAISNTAGQDYAWTIENGVLARRAITTGLRDALQDRVEVLQGLHEQATVLALKFDNLREGQKASVGARAVPATPASSAAATLPMTSPIPAKVGGAPVPTKAVSASVSS